MSNEVRKEILNRIKEIMVLLKKTDYKAIKYAEGELSASEYEETLIQRRAWRAEIRELEAKLSQ